MNTSHFSSSQRLQSPSSPSRARGFTLVEIVVSLAIFSIVAVVALGALLKIVNSNQKAQAIQSSISNLNFALDTMSRELRVGTDYYCGSFSGNTLSAPSACSGGSQISFISSNTGPNGCGLIYSYEFTGTPGNYTLEKAQQANDTCGTVNGDDIGSSAAQPYPVLSPDVIITSYYLSVSSDHYPLAFIHVIGYAGTSKQNETYFDVETAISDRNI